MSPQVWLLQVASQILEVHVIRHIVLFKLKPGYSQESPEVAVAEALAVQLGREVTSLRDWRFGRNFSNRPIVYDFAAVGLLADEEALERYLEDPFHRQAIRKWREIKLVNRGGDRLHHERYPRYHRRAGRGRAAPSASRPGLVFG